MIKRTLHTLVLVALVGAAALVGWQAKRAWSVDGWIGQPGYRFTSHAPKIEQVRRLGTLVTLEAPLSDVQTSELSGFTGSASVVLLVHGSVLVGTDLSAARYEEVDPQQKRAVLVLPEPVAQRPRVDHEKTRVYRTDRGGLWRWFPAEGAEAAAYERAMTQAQRLLQLSAQRPELLAQAREHASAVLCPFFDSLGWSVELRWEPAAEAAAATAAARGGSS